MEKKVHREFVVAPHWMYGRYLNQTTAVFTNDPVAACWRAWHYWSTTSLGGLVPKQTELTKGDIR